MNPTPPLSDRELLAAFVKNADGTAFAALTERYLGFVFGVACRRSGSREMAQEAAQNAFCQLARQAASLLPAMREGVSLAPWLHAVAMREAGTLMRAEAARQRALRRLADSAAAAQSTFSPATSTPSPPGSEHLDEALAALPEAARRVLILRYLQGMSLREVANAEDTSEEAARKRVTRALDRLTRSLARRGVTAAGVTACLAAAPVLWPAPSSAAALAARAIRLAAAPAAGSGLSGLAGFALSQWPVAAVFLLAAVPAAWPWGEVSQTVSANDASVRLSSGEDAEMAKRKAAAEGPVPPAEIAGAMVREMSLLAAKDWSLHELVVPAWNPITLRVSDFGPDPLRLAAGRRAVLDFSLEEVREAVRLCEDDKVRRAIEPALYARWAELNPEEAREAALASGSLTPMWWMFQARAATDLPGAARWASDHSPGLLEALLEPLAATDLTGYLQLMDSLDGAPGAGSKQDRYDNLFRDHPKLALEGWREEELQGNLAFSDGPLRDKANLEEVDPAALETLLSFADGLPDDSTLRAECRRVAAQVLSRDDPERAADLQVAAGTLGASKFDWDGEMESLLTDWKRRDSGAMVRWLGARSGLDPDEQRRLARAVGVDLPVGETPHAVTKP